MHYRKYQVKHDFFEIWSHEMAYTLGFISADGNVYKSSLRIDLQPRDIKVLDFVRSQISPSSPIKNAHSGKSVQLGINSVLLVKSLANLGVVPNKSLTIRVPEIPDIFKGDYIRGVFDGDGWVYCRRNGIEAGIVSGSPGFIQDIRAICGFGRIRERWHRKLSKNPLFVLDMGTTASKKLKELMYTNCCFCLERKRERFFSDFYKRSPMFWTEEQLATLKSVYKPDTRGSLKEVAKLVNHSYKAVSKKVWELGLAG